ncbi:MAG TPA: hypothetical protein VHD33_03510 [Legionellaceae bacterium]|nr:hypothetical protein [Legionellaceae bacterium]
MSTFTYITQALGYNDDPVNSNPTQSGIRRRCSVLNIDAFKPQTLEFDVAPGATKTIFSGSRTLNVDNTTTFNLTLSPLDSSTYRLTYISGTDPGFRTARSVSTSGIALTLIVNANLSLTVTAGSGTPFSAIQSGDTVFIPGTSTGDSAGPFNSLNEGFWTVLSATSTVVTMMRFPNTVFSGISEVVTPGTNTAFQAFSSDNVQIGDVVALTAAFAPGSLQSYVISSVTATFIEFSSALPLANQSDIAPAASGIAIYSSAKQWIQIESDQEVVYQLNGDTGQFNKIEPPIAGDANFVGSFHIWATIWQLVIINKSSNVANLVICTVE